MAQNDQVNPDTQNEAQNNGDLDLPAEMFRSGKEVKKVNLGIPRVNLAFEPQTEQVTYSEVDGLALFEGDIVLGTATKVEQALDERGVTIDGLQFRWGTTVNGTITEVTVPYVVIPQLEQLVKDAIAHWEQRTPIRFKKRTTEVAFISFEKLGGCFSNVGRQGGKQVISLGSGCGLGAAIHEIGHALGLWHEQSREDRDNHIQIIRENIVPEFLHNFNKHILDGTDQGPYDFGSIMHYPATAFSRNGKPTIVAKAGQPIGQRQGLSKGDISAIKAIYPDLNWTES